MGTWRFPVSVEVSSGSEATLGRTWEDEGFDGDPWSDP